MVADGGQHVENFAIAFRRVTDAIAGNDRQLQSGCKVEQGLIAALDVASIVALKFEIEIAAAVDCREPFGDLACSCAAFAY